MTDSQAPELLPCPFCGGKAHVFKDYDPDTDGKFYSYKCSSCGAQSPERYAVETCGIFFAGLRDLWNRRTPSDAQADLDRIREEGRIAGLREAADIAETWYRNQGKGTPHEEIRAHIALMELQRLGQEWDAENG